MVGRRRGESTVPPPPAAWRAEDRGCTRAASSGRGDLVGVALAVCARPRAARLGGAGGAVRPRPSVDVFFLLNAPHLASACFLRKKCVCVCVCVCVCFVGARGVKNPHVSTFGFAIK